jgi:hypothetical protein
MMTGGAAHPGPRHGAAAAAAAGAPTNLDRHLHSRSWLAEIPLRFHEIAPRTFISIRTGGSD